MSRLRIFFRPPRSDEHSISSTRSGTRRKSSPAHGNRPTRKREAFGRIRPSKPLASTKNLRRLLAVKKAAPCDAGDEPQNHRDVPRANTARLLAINRTHRDVADFESAKRKL